MKSVPLAKGSRSRQERHFPNPSPVGASYDSPARQCRVGAGSWEQVPQGRQNPQAHTGPHSESNHFWQRDSMTSTFRPRRNESKSVLYPSQSRRARTGGVAGAVAVEQLSEVSIGGSRSGEDQQYRDSGNENPSPSGVIERFPLIAYRDWGAGMPHVSRLLRDMGVSAPPRLGHRPVRLP